MEQLHISDERLVTTIGSYFNKCLIIARKRIEGYKIKGAKEVSSVYFRILHLTFQH